MEKKEIVIKEEDELIHSKDKVANRLIAQGCAASASEGLSSSYITPFALAIGASTSQIGFLSSFSGLLSPMGQLVGSRMMEKYSRRRIINYSIIFHALIFFPIVALAFLFMFNKFTIFLPIALIVLYSLSVFVFGIRYPSFFSLIGDVVSDNEKGKFFGRRNLFFALTGILCFFLASFILDYSSSIGYVLIGFAVVFMLAIIARLVSKSLFARIPVPDLTLPKGYYFSFYEFIKRYDNFGKFAFYIAFMNFAISISAPFFAVYMLKDLGFSYLTFTLVTLSSAFFYILLSPITGKFSDKYGNVKLLYIAGFLFPLVPLVWIFLENPTLLFLIQGFILGLANSCFGIGIMNFTYDSVSPQKRALCTAYNSLLSGIGIFFGSIIGGLVIQFLKIEFMSPILFVFAFSSLIMIMVSLFFLPQINESRKKDRLEGFSMDLLHHPFRAIHSDVVWFKNFIHGK